MSIKEYFSFTKRERAGIFALLAILLLVGFLPYLVPKTEPKKEPVSLTDFKKRKPDKDSGIIASFYAPDSIRQGFYVKRQYQRWEYDHYPRKEWKERKEWYPRKESYPLKEYSRKDWPKTSYVPYHKREYAPVDINSADTTAFIALPGIGSKLANRIIAFREKLGGFDSIERIREVYGLQDSVYQKLIPYLRI